MHYGAEGQRKRGTKTGRNDGIKDMEKDQVCSVDCQRSGVRYIVPAGVKPESFMKGWREGKKDIMASVVGTEII